MIDIILLPLMIGVLLTWIYLSILVIRSLRYAPRLDVYNKIDERIDIILPARNEEKFIGRCLESLLKQDYKNIRIIAIDDSSSDNTANIIKDYASRDGRVVYVYAGEKPVGWTGKNWACYQGYLRSDADLLLFTDADSIFSSNLISLAVSRFVRDSLDALTLMPRILCLDRFTCITLPLLNNLLYSRYSPLRVNNKKYKIGYFFGSFFIIKRRVYENIGTHMGVKNELVEDGALGSKVKSSGYKMMMIRAEDYFEAIWARDLGSLLNGLGRLIMPLYASKKHLAFSIIAITFFIFPFPFIMLASNLSLIAIITSSIMIGMSMLNAYNLKINPLYGLAAPLGAVIIFTGFLKGIISTRGSGIKWRDRAYAYKQYNADGFQP
ncbi:MAG: glycosyltransferase [Candidatus Nitrosocaldaceae archaeon]